jgi:hypothetical protein
VAQYGIAGSRGTLVIERSNDMNPKTLIATTGGGIARARQGADGTWRVAHLLPEQAVRCLTIDRLNPGRVYAGTHGAGVLRSEDAGATWQACGLRGQIVTAVSASPTQPELVYAGTKPAGLFVSSDGGQGWDEIIGFKRIPWRWLWFSPAEAPFIGYVQAIALSPSDPKRLVVGIEAGATVLSQDGGQTWTSHRPGALRDCHTLSFHAWQGDWVYEAGGSGGGAACSVDGGQTWTQPRVGLDRHYGWAVAADPAQPQTWYVSMSPTPFKAHGEQAAEACIYRYEGDHWQRLGGGLPQPLSHMPYALITDPDAPGTLYAGLSNGDLWLSRDCGDTWQLLPVSLGGLHRSLVLL